MAPTRPRTKQATRPRASVAAVPTEGDASESQRGGVQSLGRAFGIMEEIARHRDGIGLAELSKRVGLHNSTTFHLVKTMVSLGYVRQLKDSKKYRIGRPLFALAASALDEVEMTSLATPVLAALSQETGEGTQFAARSGDAVVILARMSGPGAFQLRDRVGGLRPANCTAIGKIMLSSLTNEQLDRFLSRTELTASTPKSIVKPDLLRREVENVRHAGMAIDDGEFDSELRCVALPVRDFTGQIIGALGLSGPLWRVSHEVLQRHARAVRAAAVRLSAEFGYTGEAEPRTDAAE
ncbi:MAG TPA: IclR family transcriptional regulator [Pseudolabrys sp.]|jgi:DNA-binding IclR family transcriptional regulator